MERGCHVLTHPMALQSTGEGWGSPMQPLSLMAFQSLQAPVQAPGGSFPQDIGFSVAALGSVPGRLWHSTQSKPECKELKTGQVLHVNDRREVGSAPALLVESLGEGEGYVGEHRPSVGRSQ